MHSGLIIKCKLFLFSLLILIIWICIVYSNINIYAQLLHNQTLFDIVNQRNLLNQHPEVLTDYTPSRIAVNEDTNTIYVTNQNSNILSVISGENHTKINYVLVGDESTYTEEENMPSWIFHKYHNIAVNEDTNTIYVTNPNSNILSVISGENHTRIKALSILSSPTQIAVNEDTNIIYVTTSNGISVISGDNYTKIDDIPLNNSRYIAVNEDTNIIYVTTSNGISVISGDNYTKINEINIDNSEEIAINEDTNIIYVTTSNGISVISGVNYNIDDIIIPLDSPKYISINEDTNTIYLIEGFFNRLKSIIIDNNNIEVTDSPSGPNPISIAVNEDTNTIYVANQRPDGVSVIDGISKKVVSGVTFNINIPNAGRIICDNINTPINIYLYVWSDTQCTAESAKGFEFINWIKTLENNSSLILNKPFLSTDANPFSSILNFLNFLGIKFENPEATFTVSEFGNYTANFKEIPLPIPKEYLIGLYTIVASTIIGWSIPSIIGWIKSHREIRKLSYYHSSIYGAL